MGDSRDRAWFLYLLRCADDSFYTGVTTDLQRRLREHNAGRGSRYTQGRRPVWLVGAWRFPDRSSAQRAEVRFKRLRQRNKEQLAAAGWPFDGAPFCGPLPHRFCPRCGGELKTLLRAQDAHPRQVCATCGRVHYRNAKPCVGMLAVREGKLLLTRRSIQPYRGDWDIPGGFLEAGEQPEAGVVREVWEETGLEVRPVEVFGFYIDQYAYQDEVDFTLNIYFLGRVVGGEEQARDEVSELGWFGPGELPARIAFAHARSVLADWVQRMRKDSK
ncbi:MAG: NUDIX domain-containing protein [Anaerolineae bacterium]|nr:NUDIX domain-containing protein [Anaerolineae bacterium]